MLCLSGFDLYSRWVPLLCEEFAPQPGGTNDNEAHVYEPICINMYCRTKHNNQEKTTHSLKEGVTEISKL